MRLLPLLCTMPLVGLAFAGGCGSSSSRPPGNTSPDGSAPPGDASRDALGPGDASSSGDAPTSCDGAACDQPPPGLLDPASTTTWNPGILADTATGMPLGDDDLPVRTTVCVQVPVQSGDATSAIQTALNGCAGKNQVVLLAAGTYSISATLQIPSGVVLRGAGSDGTTVTTILSTKGGPVVGIGTQQDGSCYDGRGFDATAEPAPHRGRHEGDRHAGGRRRLQVQRRRPRPGRPDGRQRGERGRLHDDLQARREPRRERARRDRSASRGTPSR